MSTLSTHTSRAIRNKSMAALYGIAADYDCDLSDVISVIDAALGLKRTTTQVVSYTGRDGVTKSIETTVSEPPPSQPEVSSHAPAADTPATQAAGETTDGGSQTIAPLAGDLPSVAPSPEPQPDPSAVQADAAPPREGTSPAESDAAEISAPLIPPRRKRAPNSSQPQSRDLYVQQRIIALHAEHPDWSDIEIAKHLDCKDSYVRRIAKQNAIVLPSRLQAVVLRQQQEIAEAPPPPASGTLTERVQEMHKRHPSWTARMIASALGAPLASVQSLLTFARNARPAAPTFQNSADLVDHYKNVSKRLGK